MKIIDYKILEESGRDNLAKRVKVHMLKGWQPLGGVVVKRRKFLQAMVRYEERFEYGDRGDD